MNELAYQDLVSSVCEGKRTPNATYMHRSLIALVPAQLTTLLHQVASAVTSDGAIWNVVKLHRDQFKISFLDYPSFDTDAYPCLARSRVVDLKHRRVRDLSFESDPNPPILHRKELMVSPTYRYWQEFKEITEEGEAAGLYSETRRIGFKKDWERLIAQRGYVLVDGRLFRSAAISIEEEHDEIFRERTALSRSDLSSPMRALAQYGLLSEKYTVCDYGCGRGDDVKILCSMNVDAIGWDPNFYPEGERLPSDIVNLGFVINVIEDIEERNFALNQAYQLAEGLLVVSAMIASETHVARFRPHKDGVITSRNTFQKYYSQCELRAYIERTLQQPAQPVGTGIFFVYASESFESTVVFSRQRKSTAATQRKATTASKLSALNELVKSHRPLLDLYWERALNLARWPMVEDLSETEEILDAFGSLKKAQKAMAMSYPLDELTRAEQQRREELTLAQALSFFGGRKPFSELPISIRRDIGHHFRSYKALQSEARRLLQDLTDTARLEEQCLQHFERTRHGHVTEAKAYTINTAIVDDMPIGVRAYIGCAEQLAGSANSFDLVKIHMHTGKVSFMRYEGFSSKPLPMLVERVKVDLWNQHTYYFDYIGEFRPKPLYWCSYFLLEGNPVLKKQHSFDRRLDELGLAPDNPHQGFSLEQLEEIVDAKGLKLKGFRFYKKRSNKQP